MGLYTCPSTGSFGSVSIEGIAQHKTIAGSAP